MTDLPLRCGDGGILKNGVMLVMRGMILNWGTFRQTMKGSCAFKNGSLSV